MKATVLRKDLSDALAIAASAASVRTAMPVLASIRITAENSGLTLVGCDGEMWALATCAANVETPGAVCVPQRLFSEIVGALSDGEVSLELEGTTVMLRHGQSEWKMLALPAEDFPDVPDFETPSTLSLPAGELRKSIDAVAYAVSDDTSRQSLTGVLFKYDGDVLTLVATDTHRMAVHRVHKGGIGSTLEVIVPEKALKTIKSLSIDPESEITVGFDETRLHVDIGNARVVAQLLTGQYPNWERVVPAEYTRLWTADRQELYDNVKRAMILARESANRVVFHGNGDKIVISARTEDKGEAKEEVAVISKNGDVSIAFNGRYVLEALAALDADGVQTEMTESSRAAIIRPTEGGENTFCVVMPMAIS